MAITLYFDPASGPARCIFVICKFKKAPVEFKTIDLSKKEQMQDWFIEINPHHTVPALRDEENNVNLFESTAILQYLAETFKWEGDYGFGDNKWAAINALHNTHNFTSRASLDIMMNFYMPFFQGTPFDLEKFKAAAETSKANKIALLDSVLAKNGGFIAGKTKTVADIRAWIDMFQLSTLGGEGTLGVIDFEKEFPNIYKWLSAIKEDLYSDEDWQAQVGFYKFAESKLGPEIRLIKKE